MGFYVRRSMKIAPGVRINLSNRGLGMSVGTRGFHVSQSATGRRTTSAGIPGTGIRYRKTVSSKRSQPADPALPPEAPALTPLVPHSNLPPKVVTTTVLRVLAWMLAGMFMVGGVGTILAPSPSAAPVPWWEGPLILGIGYFSARWLWVTRHRYRVPRTPAK